MATIDRTTPPPHAPAERARRGAPGSRAAPRVIEFRGVSKLYRARRRRPRGRHVRRPPRRVRVPRRLHGLGQVDAHAPAHQGARAHRAARSASPAATSPTSTARRSRTTAATSASSSRTSSCCPTARCYDNVAYALQVTGGIAQGDPREGAGHPAPHRPVARSSTTTPTSSRAASSSASRWRARSSTTRRCCWPTSRPATSTPRRRSGSCSCSTGSTAPAPRSSSPRTTRTMVDRMRRRVIELESGRIIRDEAAGLYAPSDETHRRVRRAACAASRRPRQRRAGDDRERPPRRRVRRRDRAMSSASSSGRRCARSSATRSRSSPRWPRCS